MIINGYLIAGGDFMRIGGKGLELGYKVIDVLVGLSIVGGVVGGSAVGLYALITNIVNNMSLFGAIGVWVVGGVIYLLFSVWIFTEVIGLFGGSSGGRKNF